MMKLFLKSLIYLSAIGILSFIFGRIIPREWFSHNGFLYCSTYSKKENDIYNALRVRKWKDKVPDMSRILPNMMPSKKIPKAIIAENIQLMVEETCIAELTHRLLSLLGFGCVFIWKNTKGWLISILYFFGNLPYIIIQRHNRAKLLKILERLKGKELEEII